MKKIIFLKTALLLMKTPLLRGFILILMFLTFNVVNAKNNYMPPCKVTNSETTISITSTTADLDWAANGGNDWNVEWGLPGFTPGTGSEIGANNGTTATTESVTGLAASTNYEWYVQETCQGGTWQGPFSFTTAAASSSHNIGTGDLNACTGSLFDAGGSTGDYANSEDVTETYCSDAGNCVQVSFNSFATESSYDYLYIYDGTTTSDPLIGTYDGSTSPGTISSSTGCLTFRFTSDGSSVAAGWDASLSCIACPTCTDPSALGISNIVFNGADLSWTENGTATQWDIEWGVVGFAPTGTPDVNNTTNNPYSLSGLSSSTSYDFYVRADCGGALTSSWVGPFNFLTVSQPAGSSCGDPQVLGSLPYNNTGMTTNGFGDDINPGDITCNTSYIGGDDYVFEYTPASCEEVNITLSNTDTYSGVFVFAGCPNSGGTCVASDGQSGGNPSLASVALSGGITYYFVVSTYPAPQFTAFDINITKTVVACPGDAPCSALAASTACGPKSTGTIGGLTDSGVADPGCGNYQGGDSWYSLTIPASGNVDIEGKAVSGGVSDLAVAVYTAAACGGGKTLLSCNDDGGTGSMPYLSLTGLTAGNTLYIRVWEPGDDAVGAYELEITNPDNLFCLTDNASMYNFPTDTCMQVTSATNSQKGCAWYQNTLDFSQSFDHTMEVYLGTNDGGADGMTFTFHNDPQGTTECGNDGQQLGAGGIQNAVVIEIDTYDNGGNDPAEDHVAIWTSNSGEGSPISGPVSATSPATDIEDGVVHTMRITWDASTNTMEVYFDGVLRLSVSDDFVTNVFGTNNVFWGSTGSTGGFNNQQYVCPPASLISLPIELVRFTSLCNGENVKLLWATASEINNDYFTIERSFDGVNFEEVDRLQGGGNSNQLKEYVWVDDNPLVGASYYRLKQTDFDGKFSYSLLKASNCKSEDAIFSLYPNPVLEKVMLASSSEFSVQYQIVAVDGRVVAQGSFVHQKQVDLSTLSSGAYFVRALSKNEIFQEKLIKN